MQNDNVFRDFSVSNPILIHGDCLEIMKSIPFEILQRLVVVGDPPFNIGYHYNGYDDNMPENEYYGMLISVFGPYRHVIVHYPEQLYRYSMLLGKPPERVVSWVYNSNTAKQHRDIAFFGVKPDFRKMGQPYKNPKDKRIAKRISEGKTARMYDWWNVNQVKNVSKDKTIHPCQMPEEVMLRVIGLLPDDAIILDPFMGSGTTGVAARNLGRKFIGIEKDEMYFKTACDRIKNPHNGKA